MRISSRAVVRRLLAGLAIAVGVWLLAALVWLGLAWHDARSGSAQLDDAAETFTPEGLVAGEGLDVLFRARMDFGRSNGRVGSWLLAPVRLLPGIGPQVRSARALTGSAMDVLEAGIDAIREARDAIDDSRSGGPARVAAMRRIASVAASTRERLDAVDLGLARTRAGPLAGAGDTFELRLRDLEDAVDRLREAAHGLAGFLEGPRVYLVFAANNNEMRVGSGTFLSVGILAVDGGNLSLMPMVPTANLKLEPAQEVRLDPDVENLWGWIHPGREWRNLASTPRFEVTAKQAVRMADAYSPGIGRVIDGVLALDPVALDALVAATGPVRVGGVELQGGEVVPTLLLLQYLGIEDFVDPQQQRREALSDIAQTVVANLDAGHWEAPALVRELRAVGGGRHVLVWSRHPDEQRAWEVAGVTGILDDRSVMFGLHNRGGNKLDQFLVVGGAIGVQPGPDGTEVSMEITVENRTPEGLPRYVAGPYPGSVGGGEGVYQGFAVIEVPGSARDLRLTGGIDDVAAGPDGPHRVAAVYVKLRRGERVRLQVQFRMPGGVSSLRIEPSARVPAVAWTYWMSTWQDTEARTITW